MALLATCIIKDMNTHFTILKNGYVRMCISIQVAMLGITECT